MEVIAKSVPTHECLSCIEMSQGAVDEALVDTDISVYYTHMSVFNEISVHTPYPLSPDRTMELVLEALRELIDYELAVVLSLEPEGDLRVRKALGPLYTRRLDGYSISLAERRDLASILEHKEPHLFDELEDHVDTYHGVLELPEGHSCLASPLYVEETPIGLLTLDHRTCKKFTPTMVRFISSISKLISVSMAQSDASRLLMERTRKLLEERNRLLGDASELFKDLVGVSSAWRRVLDKLRLVAASEVPVLLMGETGTGKEQVARKLHALSPRADRPFVAVNCSALVPSLAESEFFGHERGSFSGAVATRRGRFEMADGGTLFLDEVGDLPQELQPKLLRVLQDGVYERVGAERSLRADVRILAATNANMVEAVDQGRFREDLLYRLNVFPITLPPLRERDQDAALLAEHFVSQIRGRSGFQRTALTASALEKIGTLPWRGNVRELRNVIERAAILARGGDVGEEHLVGLSSGADPLGRRATNRGALGFDYALEELHPERQGPFPKLEEIQRRHILKALEHSSGRLYGPSGAAELLGMKPTTLQSRMKKLGLSRARG